MYMAFISCAKAWNLSGHNGRGNDALKASHKSAIPCIRRTESPVIRAKKGGSSNKTLENERKSIIA